MLISNIDYKTADGDHESVLTSAGKEWKLTDPPSHCWSFKTSQFSRFPEKKFPFRLTLSDTLLHHCPEGCMSNSSAFRLVDPEKIPGKLQQATSKLAKWERFATRRKGAEEGTLKLAIWRDYARFMDNANNNSLASSSAWHAAEEVIIHRSLSLASHTE